ncbi:hypothetical protein JB92DRAFT_2839226 [Gautieria morchelliformis]|nr:hypothetical protein JB92DRAFT_2839226 [Gautieria morchelliformis]
MKGRYILAAANDWNGETAEKPLPLTIPDEKLAEIGLPHPPFPPIYQLTYNFLLLPESPDVIRGRLTTWQDNSRQLAAWIRKAKLKTAVLPKTSWKWPTPPTPACFDDSDGESSTDDLWPSNSSEHNTVLGESPEPAPRVARSFNAEVQASSPKRYRDFSPVDEARDGSEPNKKQLVLWQPSIVQLLERQLMLLRGESCGPSSTHNSVLGALFQTPPGTSAVAAFSDLWSPKHPSLAGWLSQYFQLSPKQLLYAAIATVQPVWLHQTMGIMLLSAKIMYLAAKYMVIWRYSLNDSTNPGTTCSPLQLDVKRGTKRQGQKYNDNLPCGTAARHVQVENKGWQGCRMDEG